MLPALPSGELEQRSWCSLGITFQWDLARGHASCTPRGAGWVVQPVCSRTWLVAGIRVAGQKVALPILRWRGPIGSGQSREFGGNAAETRHCQAGYGEGEQGLREPKAISVNRQGSSLDTSGVRVREHPGASSSTGKILILLITESDCAKLLKLGDYCKLPKRMSLARGLKSEHCRGVLGFGWTVWKAVLFSPENGQNFAFPALLWLPWQRWVGRTALISCISL